MDETDDEAGVGHNLDPDAERGLAAARDYQIGIAKERAGFEQAKIGRDQAIGAAVRYGQALIDGRARRRLSNNAFGDWVKASLLDRDSPFDQRQERQAAMQIAEIALKHVASTVDGTATVNPFDGCPHSRPTNIMRWWRAKQPKPAPASRPAPATDAPKAAPSPAPPVPPTAPRTAPTAPDRVQRVADSAEVETLRKEVWRLKDKLDQLAIFLVKEPPPKAENRPVLNDIQRAARMPMRFGERRPKDVPPMRFVTPPANDPDFALRREEFEQWLVRRKEALEADFAKRTVELEKAFDAKVKTKVEAQRVRDGTPWEDYPRTTRLKKANAIYALKRFLAKRFEERLEVKPARCRERRSPPRQRPTLRQGAADSATANRSPRPSHAMEAKARTRWPLTKPAGRRAAPAMSAPPPEGESPARALS